MIRSRTPAGLPELDVDQRRGFTGITDVEREGNTTDAARFFLPSDADEERMLPRGLNRVKTGHGTSYRCDDLAIGKADPLPAILIETLAADRPVGLLVLTTVRMDLPGDLWRQPVGNALHGAPRGIFRLHVILRVIRRVSRAPQTGAAIGREEGWGQKKKGNATRHREEGSSSRPA